MISPEREAGENRYIILKTKEIIMDFMELCHKRQSCRDFADRPVEHEKLVKCLEAARLTPSGCNAQPWSFVVAENPEVVAEVAKCAQQLGINEYISGAKAFFVVLEEHAVLMPAIRKILDSQYFAKGDLGPRWSASVMRPKSRAWVPAFSVSTTGRDFASFWISPGKSGSGV